MRLISLLCLTLLQPAAWAQETLLKLGNTTIRAEIADTPQSRERGLMQREQLCGDCGMLFVFERADRYAFWMKNTLLPLSIAFISADGHILNIEDMQPGTTALHYAAGAALYALEVNQGWFARNGIAPGGTIPGLPLSSRR